MNRRTFLALPPAAAWAVAAAKEKAPRGAGWKPLFAGGTMAGWHPQDTRRPNTWRGSRAVRMDAADATRLAADEAGGGEYWNGPEGKAANIVSDERFGDLELVLEFMVPKGSNSGVYLQGLYEIQIFDSHGVEHPKTSDCGAIYHRWIDGKPAGGSPPQVNASRRPGEWQSLYVRFRAPRFDAQGRKTENARFLRVLLNGKLVQDNVEVEGGTRSHMPVEEAARNPLMLQGDHGPVAYRGLYARALAAEGGR